MAGMGVKWNEFQTMRIANGMCGVYYTEEQVASAGDSSKTHVTNPTAVGKITNPGGGQDQLSVTYWINNTTNKFPIICAYAGLDYVVGINQFATLQKALDEAHVTYYSKPSDNVNGYVYFRNSKHEEITEEKDPTNYHRLIDAVDTWCQE